MVPRQSIPLAAIRIAPNQPEYQALLDWPLDGEPFYTRQIIRLLKNDIPHRVMYGFGLMWIFLDPDRNIVGFGTLDVCDEYSQFAAGKNHCYIPLLAVNPQFQRRGHGQGIVEYLVAEAMLIAKSPHDLSDLLFLDVYTANQGAIALYQKCGFVTLNPGAAIADPIENDEEYIIMVRKVSSTSNGS